MTLTEQTEMDAFLEEALATGRIRQSKSPLGAALRETSLMLDGTVIECEVTRWVNSMPSLLSYNHFAYLQVDTLIQPEICNIESKEVIHPISHPPIPN
jgi:hypothetical protein